MLFDRLFYRYYRLMADSFARLRYASVLAMIACLLALWIPSAQAQNTGLDSLLDLYPEDQVEPIATMTIFTAGAKSKIGQVNAGIPYTTVRQAGRWQMIRFSVPTAPIWVSEDFINMQGDVAEVRVDRLNGRLRPSGQSPIVIALNRGYSSKISDSKNGFAKIKAPASLIVAIPTNLAKSSPPEAERRTAPARQVQAATTPQRNEQTKVPPPVAAPKPSTKTQLEPNKSLGDRQQEDLSAPQFPVQESLTERGLNNEAPVGEVAPSSNDDAIEERPEQLHLIAPGDAISLLVFGEEDLSAQNIRVPQSGRVSLPLIGAVDVGGKTTLEVEEIVRRILAQGYVKNPRLSVTIFSYRPIFIRGAVRSTGSFPYTEGLTVAKALALAGGTKNSAQPDGVSILRDGETIVSGLPLDSQYQIASGDVLSISEALGVGEDSAVYIYLHGEVAAPGEYLFRRGLTVEKAIVLAGGFTLRASPNKVRLTRYNGVPENEEPIKIKNAELYTLVEPGDVINVGARWF